MNWQFPQKQMNVQPPSGGRIIDLELDSSMRITFLHFHLRKDPHMQNLEIRGFSEVSQYIENLENTKNYKL